MKWFIIALVAVAVIAAAVLLSGCSRKGDVMDGDGMLNTKNGAPGEAESTKAEPAAPGTAEASGPEVPTERTAEPSSEEEDMTPSAVPYLTANGKSFSIYWDSNSSAEAFFAKMKEGDVEVAMHDYGGFEKVGPLPWDLPRNDTEITTKPGDIILYQGNQITIYYGENTWNFTRLGHIPDVTKEELLEAFGTGDVTVTFKVEWTE